MLIGFTDHTIPGSLRTTTQSQSKTRSVYTGQTITLELDSSYTPTVSSNTNCTYTISTTNASSPLSTTTVVISFSSSSIASYSITIYQGYGGKTYQLSGSVLGTGTGPQSLSMGGSDVDRSINVEIGQASSDQISLDDKALRYLVDIDSPGEIDIQDFYNKDAKSRRPIDYEASMTYTDTNIPSLITSSPTSNSIISGTTYWRRLQLTWTGDASSTVRLYIRGRRDGNALSYTGDAQFGLVVIAGTEYRFQGPAGSDYWQGWQTTNISSSSTFPTSGYSTITAFNQSANNGRFVIRANNSPTPSSSTGRLSNIAGSGGYGYFETSGTSITSGYYHARSPEFSLENGDLVDVYYGVDCTSLYSLKFHLSSS